MQFKLHKKTVTRNGTVYRVADISMMIQNAGHLDKCSECERWSGDCVSFLDKENKYACDDIIGCHCILMRIRHRNAYYNTHPLPPMK